MRFLLALPLAAVVATASLPAMAGSGDRICDYQLRYDIDMDSQGLSLTQADEPSVRIEQGRLWIDGQRESLSASEQKRLRQYERDMRRFSRDTVDVAVQGMQLGLQGAATAIAALTGEPLDAQTRQRMRTLELQFKNGLDAQHLSAEHLSTHFDDEIDEAVDELTGDLMEQAIGGAGKLMALALFAPSRLEARADRVEQMVKTQIEGPASQLERQADGLCQQLQTLDMLENSIGRFDAFERKDQGPSI